MPFSRLEGDVSQTTPTTETRRQLWSALGDMVQELADYLHQPLEAVQLRCRGATDELARAWCAGSPTTPEAITDFYRATDLYLYDLTWWHALGTDDSALVQVQALEVARACKARMVLDFGSGIGSLGLLLAQHGFSVTLADINPHLNAYARWRFEQRGLPAGFLDPAQQSLPTQAFDFISAIDVLEHLPEPHTALATLAAALRPGGTLFIHLPPAASAAHPMHLWHDPAVLLPHLDGYGLWLESASNGSLILRRGEGPRYTLKPVLSLLPGAQGGLLLSLRPMVVMHLNSQAFALLSRLGRSNGVAAGATAAEIAAAVPSLSFSEVTAFLDTLARRRLLRRTPPVTGAWTTVSIIIPAYGRPAATRACVESLLALDYPPDCREVIVVDDASHPPLASALDGLPIRLLRQEQNIGQSAARNLAAAEAQGELLAFIDNDCIAKPDWLRTLVPYLDDPSISIVGGRVIAPEPDGLVAAFEAVRSPLDMGAIDGEVGPDQVIAYLPTCNLIVRRELMLRQGGFNADMLLGEDVDFIWRALRSGTRACYVTTGRIVHYHRVALPALLQRRADYGSSEAELQLRHPQGQRVMVLPFVGLCILASLAMLTLPWPIFAVPLVVALISVSRELRTKSRRLHEAGAKIPLPQLIAAILREHTAALYHLGANVTRYYSLPLLAAAIAWPGLLPALALLLLLPAISDYYRHRPRLSPFVFVGLYWLEMAAYQSGVWYGCIKKRTLRPLLPIIRLSR